MNDGETVMSKSKFIIIAFSDGDYKIPADIIAKDRAKYYAELDSERGDGEYDEIYKEEYEYTMNDNYELIDWAENNMDWSDISDQAERISISDDVDHNYEWINANKRVEEL